MQKQKTFNFDAVFDAEKSKEIQAKRVVIDKEFQRIAKILEIETNTWRKDLRKLQERCPHKNMSGAQYVRWCNDCGYEENTS